MPLFPSRAASLLAFSELSTAASTSLCPAFTELMRSSSAALCVCTNSRWRQMRSERLPVVGRWHSRRSVSSAASFICEYERSCKYFFCDDAADAYEDAGEYEEEDAAAAAPADDCVSDLTGTLVSTHCGTWAMNAASDPFRGAQRLETGQDRNCRVLCMPMIAVRIPVKRPTADCSAKSGWTSVWRAA